jgi:hypothetical protein
LAEPENSDLGPEDQVFYDKINIEPKAPKTRSKERITMKMIKNTKRKFAMLLLTLLLVWGCAGMGTTGSKYMDQRTFQTGHDISIQEATSIAVQALQIMGVTLTKQNAAAGFLTGELKKGFWINRVTYFVEVHISTPGGGMVKAHATAVAGPEVAYTDYLDNIVEDFYKEFEKNLSTNPSSKG